MSGEQQRSFKDHKVGDWVYVVPVRRNDQRRKFGFPAQICKVGRKFASAVAAGGIVRFTTSDGRSYDPEGLLRVNGLGYDIYQSEEQFEEIENDWHQRQTLFSRLGAITHGEVSITIPIDVVKKINALLDEVDARKFDKAAESR